MQWLRRFLGVRSVEFAPIRIEGDPASDFTLDNWKAVAEMFVRVPGLQEAVRADFDDTMATLKECLLKGKDHLELVRLGQKLVDLHAHLSMPRTAISEANRILSSMEMDQRAPEPKAPAPKTVM